MQADIERLKAAPEHIIELSIEEQYSIPYADVVEIQLQGVRKRFATLVDHISMLGRLAEEQGISSISEITDIAPLLFAHVAYKSYSLSLLEEGRFDRLTRWLSGFTVHDLSGIDVSQCDSIDAWVKLLAAETPLRLLHSSGTSGKLSFIPRSIDEVLHSVQGHLRMLDPFRDEPSPLGVPPSEATLIVPGYRHGGAALQRYIDGLQRTVFHNDSNKIVALNPGYFSADLLSIGGRLQAAQNKGELGHVKLSAGLIAKRDAFVEEQRALPRRMEEFLDRLDALRGQCVWFLGGFAPTLYGLAVAGRERGIKGLFDRRSFATGGGGSKGKIIPDNWADQFKEFSGIDKLNPGYGMSELTCISRICPNDHYHFPPWWVPFLLDPETGAQRPRTGTQIGRFGAFDLNARSYWGGFLTGDEVTVSWGDSEPCPCGRIGPYAHKTIRRYTEKEGGDDKINCAGAPNAHERALEYLLEHVA